MKRLLFIYMFIVTLLISSLVMAAPDSKVVAPVGPDAAVAALKDGGAKGVGSDLKTAPGAVQTPSVKGEPKDIEAVLKTGQDIVSAIKSKSWWSLSALIAFMLMFLWKKAGVMFGFREKLGKRVDYIVLGALGLVAMFLSKFIGNVSWAGAVSVLTEVTFMGFLVDFVKRGVMGVEIKTTINPK